MEDFFASMPQIFIGFLGSSLNCFTFLGINSYNLNSYSRLLICSLGLSGLEMENMA